MLLPGVLINPPVGIRGQSSFLKDPIVSVRLSIDSSGDVMLKGEYAIQFSLALVHNNRHNCMQWYLK